MAIRNYQLAKRNCASIVALIATCVFVTGCQITNPSVSSIQSKSIEQIAEESIQAADKVKSVDQEFGQFETITPNEFQDEPVSRGITNRLPRSRPVSTGGVTSAFVDEIFDQTDVREALQAIASQANVSIIVDDQVAGTVTALIQNEPLDQALRKVLLPLGLHYRIVNGEYLVCNSDPTSPMFSIISDRLDYLPVHTSPTELLELLSEKNKKFVRIAPKRNMLIVEAPSEIAHQIVSELRRFDQPVPQVVLEAMVVVVSPDSGFQFGSNIRQGVQPLDGDADITLAVDGLALSGNLSGAVISNLFRRFAVTSFFIRALEQEGYLTIRATPHVMAKHGEKAEISIARETFFSIQPPDSQQFFRQDIQKVEAGISLIITPTIRGENVTMVIEKAEVSEDIRATVSDPAVNNPFPLINRRQVSTTVNVKDGETIVIGGLMQNQLVDRVSAVPVLSNVPLIGRFFTQITQEEQAAEVVVFISPRIVNNSCDHPMAGAEHSAQACNEYCHQRRFPRNNGLELGGPVVAPASYEQGVQGGYVDPSYVDPNYVEPNYPHDIGQRPIQPQIQQPTQSSVGYPQGYQQVRPGELRLPPSGQHVPIPAGNQPVGNQMQSPIPILQPAQPIQGAVPSMGHQSNHIPNSSRTRRRPKSKSIARRPNRTSTNPQIARSQPNNPLRQSSKVQSSASRSLRDGNVRQVAYEQILPANRVRSAQK